MAELIFHAYQDTLLNFYPPGSGRKSHTRLFDYMHMISHPRSLEFKNQNELEFLIVRILYEYIKYHLPLDRLLLN
jgi:hypothetical protein